LFPKDGRITRHFAGYPLFSALPRKNFPKIFFGQSFLFSPESQFIAFLCFPSHHLGKLVNTCDAWDSPRFARFPASSRGFGHRVLSASNLFTMPITKHDLDTLVTKGDLQELMDTVRALLAQAQTAIKDELKALHFGQKNTPRFLSPVQFAELLALKPNGRSYHPDTIRIWCKEGRIKATQEGGLRSSWMIPYEELDRIYLRASSIEPERPR
jgi:hypothetical protein